MPLRPGFRRGYVSKRKRTRAGERCSWWARVVFVGSDGKRREIRRRADSQQDAKALLEELLDEAKATDGISLEADDTRWEQFLDEFKKTHLVPVQHDSGGNRLKGYRAKSLETLRYQLETLKTAPEFAGKRLRAITSADLEAYRNRRAAEQRTRRCRDCACPDCTYATSASCKTCSGTRVSVQNCQACAGTGRIANPRRCPDCNGRKSAKACKTCKGARALEKQRSVGATNRELAQLSHIFAIAEQKRLIVKSPFDADRLVKSEKASKRRVVLSREQEVRLLEAFSPTIGGRRMRLVTIACVDTGCRLGEIKQMLWSDIDFGAGTIYIPALRTKTNVAREVPLSARLRAELLAWRELYDSGDGPVIGSAANITRLWDAARRRAGLMHMVANRQDFGPLRIHDLRHSAASRLLGAGVSLPEIAQILGHSDLKSLRMTLGYANPTPDTYNRAAAALNAFHGLMDGATVN